MKTLNVISLMVSVILLMLMIFTYYVGSYGLVLMLGITESIRAMLFIIVNTIDNGS